MRNRERSKRRNGKAAPEAKNEPIRIDGPDWRIFHRVIEGKNYYHAKFENRNLPYVKHHDTHGLKKWVKEGRVRPNTIQDALACVPAQFSSKSFAESIRVSDGADCELYFDGMEMAVRMESAFWLERQFGKPTKRWFEQDLSKMIERLYVARRTQLNAIC